MIQLRRKRKTGSRSKWRRRRGEERRVSVQRLALFVLAVAAVIAVASSDGLHAWIRGLVEQLEVVVAAHPTAGMAAFVAISALSAMLAFFSSALVVPVGVLAWGETVTFALLWLGWLIGGVTSYVIGRYVGRRVAHWIAPPERLAYFEDRLSRHARFPVILLFQLALPSEIPGYVLGVLHYSFPTYVLALALAELPYAVGAVFIGESFLERRYLPLAVLGLAGVALSAVALRALYLRLDQRGEKHRVG